MGRERSRKRKHLFLYLAGCVMALSLTACNHNLPKKPDTDPLERTAAYIRQGNFKAALAESERVLRTHPLSHGDRALFQKGWIYVHPRNPKSDPHEAMQAFKELIRKYPNSALKDQAEAWNSALSKAAQDQMQISGLQNKTSDLEKETQRKGQEIQKLKQQTADQAERVGKLKRQVQELENQLEKLKNIDIGIEQKKRTVAPQ